MCVCNPSVCVCLPASDLERSVEGLQKNLSVNKGLVTEQEVEKKSMELRRLGETLTELKSQCIPVLLPSPSLHGGHFDGIQVTMALVGVRE